MMSVDPFNRIVMPIFFAHVFTCFFCASRSSCSGSLNSFLNSPICGVTTVWVFFRRLWCCASGCKPSASTMSGLFCVVISCMSCGMV